MRRKTNLLKRQDMEYYKFKGPGDLVRFILILVGLAAVAAGWIAAMTVIMTVASAVLIPMAIAERLKSAWKRS